ncbi:Oidioi.mRNA.OKI2018_I69.XSR.g14739.t1.cds [Oikopleura dioica]|uniref:Oidioi.mRNA.OKI2018_I69.XSR.g14739.t1.cds n=1 Tax=Oikopleura dioica TaxID=34765 RepID=A0ABN7SJN7_OIKDI|nr:Oidioi.mRNA.OKI2018_I69.XSR.g14739.t1.cds [Oikopleura dioica]
MEVMAGLTQEELDFKEQPRKWVCSENLAKHIGNAVTILCKVMERVDENKIIVSDMVGQITCTCNNEELFLFAEKDDYVQLEGWALSETEIQCCSLEELKDEATNDETVLLRTKAALMMDQYSAVVYAQ